MAHIDTEIDWLACDLIEQVPGKVSGRPIVRGTRIMPDPIVNSYDLGDSIEEIHEGFAEALDKRVEIRFVSDKPIAAGIGAARGAPST